jgi:serine/threonine protein kinase
MGDELIGRVFAEKYQIDSLLGRGGMGAVYKAHHQYLQRTVAIKLVHSSLLSGDQGFKRFLREAQVLNSLAHPNAVELYDFGIQDKTPYLIMEFLQGETLKDILSREKFLPVDRCARFLTAICGALSEAHGKGIIHRDIKPGNVMVAEPDDPAAGKVVKVLDFGISKVLAPEDINLVPTDLTRTDMLLGSPRYIAPEQALGEDIDQKADLYSLGVMTYEMLNGAPPFSGATSANLIAQHLQQVPQPFDKGRKIRPALRKVIMKALAKKPADRQANVDQFLEQFLLASGQAPRSPASAGSIGRAGDGGSEKNEAKNVLGAATAVLVIGLTAVLLINSDFLRKADDAGPAPDETTSTAGARISADSEPAGPDDIAATARPVDSVQDRTPKTTAEPPVGQAERPVTGPVTQPVTGPVTQPVTVPDTELVTVDTDAEPAGDGGQGDSTPPVTTAQAARGPTPIAGPAPQTESGNSQAVQPLTVKPEPGLYIELKRMPTLEQASQLQELLQSKGFPVSVVSASLQGKPIHEVLVGPFTSIPEAKLAGARLQELAEVDGSVSRMRTIF